MNVRLCPTHSAEWQSWLGYRIPARLRIATSAARDDTAEGLRDRRRGRHEDWRSTIQLQQQLIREACARECGVFNVLELFAGIGGLGLGLERAGMTVVGQVEIDEFCRRVLSKHWPNVPRHGDVRTCVQWWRVAARPRVDVVAGGFPCQPFSTAGRRRGVADERWGWPWMERVVRDLRPRFVIVENVAALLDDSVAFGWILGDLAKLGFDAEWGVLSACAVGAPHTRERVFVLAYAEGERFGEHGRLEHQPSDPERHLHHWATQPEPRRVADGVPSRMVRLRGLGGAVVPQVSEHIARLIMSAAEGGDTSP